MTAEVHILTDRVRVDGGCEGSCKYEFTEVYETFESALKVFISCARNWLEFNHEYDGITSASTDDEIVNACRAPGGDGLVFSDCTDMYDNTIVCKEIRVISRPVL